PRGRDPVVTGRAACRGADRRLHHALLPRLLRDGAATRTSARMTKRTLERVWSPQLKNRRTIDVYLPSSYASGRRYPVVYMQDGQNLSDPATAFAGTWDLDGALERLAASGLDAIVVGVHNMGEARLAEYSPFPDRRHGGGGADAYLEFLTATI